MVKAKGFALGFILALAAPMFSVPGSWASEAKPPNILIMVTDDQRWDELGVVQAEQGERARFSFLKTPRLDALASQGVRFRNAFVTTSLCAPSRAAILTGQYNHTNGTINNDIPFLPRPTWATALRDRGYTTAMIGKWHQANQWERPGFDFVASFIGQGDYYDTAFNVNGKYTKTKGYVDKRSVDFAIQFLEKQGDKPFAMMVGFKAPHQPFTPMKKHANDYARRPRVLPTPNIDAVAPWIALKPPTLPPPIFQNKWKKIFPTLNSLDENVGRLLDALDSMNLSDNTLVIFTSDNGYYLGEHRLGDKRSAYEESMRVPLLVRFPGVIEAGTVSDAMVLNIDLAPTILDMAGEKIPVAMQGQSLRPLFRDKSVPWRSAFLYENWQLSLKPGAPTILAVRTDTHKLITYPDYEKWTELFDLSADPYETKNIAGYASAEKKLIEMCSLLQQLLTETRYISRPSIDTWLLDLEDPLVNTSASEPLRRPPLKQRSC